MTKWIKGLSSAAFALLLVQCAGWICPAAADQNVNGIGQHDAVAHGMAHRPLLFAEWKRLHGPEEPMHANLRVRTPAPAGDGLDRDDIIIPPIRARKVNAVSGALTALNLPAQTANKMQQKYNAVLQKAARLRLSQSISARSKPLRKGLKIAGAVVAGSTVLALARHHYVKRQNTNPVEAGTPQNAERSAATVEHAPHTRYDVPRAMQPSRKLARATTSPTTIAAYRRGQVSHHDDLIRQNLQAQAFLDPLQQPGNSGLGREYFHPTPVLPQKPAMSSSTTATATIPPAQASSLDASPLSLDHTETDDATIKPVSCIQKEDQPVSDDQWQAKRWVRGSIDDANADDSEEDLLCDDPLQSACYADFMPEDWVRTPIGRGRTRRPSKPIIWTEDIFSTPHLSSNEKPQQEEQQTSVEPLSPRTLSNGQKSRWIASPMEQTKPVIESMSAWSSSSSEGDFDSGNGTEDDEDNQPHAHRRASKVSAS